LALQWDQSREKDSGGEGGNNGGNNGMRIVADWDKIVGIGTKYFTLSISNPHHSITMLHRYKVTQLTYNEK